jgi:16S rRNA (guanine527-N7)-methyltransferase
MMDSIQMLLRQLLAEKQICITDEQLSQFDLYYRELVSWNEKMNLTAITERDQVYLKHFYDSVTLSFFVPFADLSSMADVGSGAGFPGIPLKIMFPHIQLTIIDSLNKRIQFLQHLTSTLGLSGVYPVHSRAEDAGRNNQFRDRFDLVTARAVARLQVLTEFCLPLVRTGGQFAAMKGVDASDEITEAAYSLSELKGRIVADYRFELPMEQASRRIIVVNKIGATPSKYPRKAGLPAKQPLIR